MLASISSLKENVLLNHGGVKERRNTLESVLVLRGAERDREGLMHVGYLLPVSLNVFGLLCGYPPSSFSPVPFTSFLVSFLPSFLYFQYSFLLVVFFPLLFLLRIDSVFS